MADHQMADLATPSSKPSSSKSTIRPASQRKPKSKGRPRARPRRRRVPESGSESEHAEDDAQSISSHSGSDPEDEKSPAKQQPVPLADEAKASHGDAVADTSRGQGGKQTGKKDKVFTKEQTERYEQRKAKMKEKQKAKKAAAKEEKKKQRERDAKANESKPTDKAEQNVEEELVESTAALTLDGDAEAPTPALPASPAPADLSVVATPQESARRPPTGPRGPPGAMWPHGIRPPPFDNGPRIMGPWRGRGDPRAFRGGFRGRGRGGFVPPFARQGFAPFGPRRQELAASANPVDKDSDDTESAPEADKEVATSAPAEKRWGNDGYEAMRAAEQASRMSRGRGRGFFPGRGFHPRPPFHHDFAGPSRPRPSSVHSAQSASIELFAESPSTQPVAETLLETDKVSSIPPNSSTPDLEASVDTLDEAKRPPSPPPAFIQPQPLVAIPAPAFSRTIFSDGTASPAPYGVAGSENGSVSSNGHPPFAHPASFLPPGVGIGPAGDYFNLADGSPVDFRPMVNGQHGHFHGYPYFPPQSYSPDFFQPPSRSGSFSSLGGFVGPRSASPFSAYNPYAVATPGGAFYPSHGPKLPGGGEAKGDGFQSYEPAMYHAQHYNPYLGPGGDPGQGYVDYAPEYGY